MKKRNLPYGYQYHNGAVMIHLEESRILKEMIKSYLTGASLQDIATRLNQQNIEYMPGITSWNKSRLMRILEDERHLGDSQYPPIISSDTHQAILNVKNRRNTQLNTDQKHNIQLLGIPIICPECGAEMRRRQDMRNECHQRWYCPSESCKLIIPIGDDDLIAAVTAQLKKLSQHPDRIQANTADPVSTPEIQSLDRSIRKALNGVVGDKESIRKKILNCVSLKYQQISDSQIVSRRLMSALRNESFLGEGYTELIRKTVKQIRLHTDGSVCLTLINDQRLEREGD